MRNWFKTQSTILLILSACLSNLAFAEIQKSPNDHREYRAFQLENKMNVMVISDAESEVAAASLSLQIGGGDDFEHRPGIAHFLEHMLFIGTEKFPAVDEYRSFIHRNGGESNAYTGLEVTNYNFFVNSNAVDEALNRFSQFFISPLLSPEFVEREREVVDAEFEIRKQSDGGKRWSAMKALFNPKHPVSKFISGNSDTLAGDVRKDLVAFFEKYYSANLMTLVILGPQSLEELQAVAVKYFSEVKNQDTPKPQTAETQFNMDLIPAVLMVKTDADEPRLQIQFPIFNLRHHWREHPEQYISHLVGHEGQGSLLSYLKQQGWADGLYASVGLSSYESYTLHVSVSLTDSGFENWESIVDSLFDYIDLIRRAGIDQWRFDEQKALSEIDFTFLEAESARSYVTTLADLLPSYPLEAMFKGVYVPERFDSELITKILGLMTPENAVIVLSSPNVETNSVTPIVGAEYSVTQISDSTLSEWEEISAIDAFALPSKNRFIPNDLSFVDTKSTELPDQIHSREGFELWHQTDKSFDVPRSNFYFSIRSPASNNDAKNSALLSLFTTSLNEQLNEFTYPALIAGLRYQLYPHSRGVSVKVSGYIEKQEVMLKQILDAFQNPKFDEASFERFRKDAIRSIENSTKEDAYDQSMKELYELLVYPHYSDDELLHVLNELTLDDLRSYANEFFEEINIVALSHGNTTEEDSLRKAELVVNTLIESADIVHVDKAKLFNMPEEGPYIKRVQVDHEDSAVAVYIQGESRDLDDRAKYSLLAQIIRTPFFSELRTHQKLGYVVFASNMQVMKVPGLIFVIQSPDKSPDSLSASIAEFLSSYHLTLNQMTEAEFDQHRNGLTNRILVTDKSLSDRSSRYWQSLDDKDYNFDRRERFVAAIENLNFESFKSFVQDLLTERSEGRVIVEAYGKDRVLPTKLFPEEGQLVENSHQFRNSMKLFP